MISENFHLPTSKHQLISDTAVLPSKVDCVRISMGMGQYQRLLDFAPQALSSQQQTPAFFRLVYYVVLCVLRPNFDSQVPNTVRGGRSNQGYYIGGTGQSFTIGFRKQRFVWLSDCKIIPTLTSDRMKNLANLKRRSDIHFFYTSLIPCSYRSHQA